MDENTPHLLVTNRIQHLTRAREQSIVPTPDIRCRQSQQNAIRFPVGKSNSIISPFLLSQYQRDTAREENRALERRWRGGAELGMLNQECRCQGGAMRVG